MATTNVCADRMISGQRTLAAALFLILFSVTFISATPITPDMASRVACNHLQSMHQEWGGLVHLEGETLELAVLTELRASESNELSGYVAELAPVGFIVLSADTRITPVLAYSFHSDFPWEEHSLNTLLYMVRTDLELRNQALSLTAPDVLAVNERLWERYLSGLMSAPATEQWPSAGSTATGGWVETTWNQGYPYNAYCPKDPGSGQRCVVGCVATAMSQIVDYHSERRNYMADVQLYQWDRYTSQMTSPYIHIDQDSSTYDFPSFDVMNEYLKDLRSLYISDTRPEYYGFATLAFTCGIYVKMHYSSGGSGTMTSKVAFALMFKFQYPSAMHMDGYLPSFYDTLSSNMKDSMPAELSIHHPDGSYGHAIVCDGLRETEGEDDRYHLNFGWGGSSPDPISAAWYVLPEGMPVGYRIVSGGVVCIIPPTGSGTDIEENAESSPTRFFIETTSPNIQTAPGTFTLSYGLPSPTRVRLRIFDINGRSLKILADKTLPSGHHTAVWDGLDEQGCELPTGTYFCLLETREGSCVTKMILLR